jgi:hypothetical protein
MTNATIESASVAAWLGDQMRILMQLPESPAHDASPATLGLTSLAAMTLQYRLMCEHRLSLTLEELMGSDSIAELAQLAQGRGTA